MIHIHDMRLLSVGRLIYMLIYYTADHQLSLDHPSLPSNACNPVISSDSETSTKYANKYPYDKGISPDLNVFVPYMVVQ